MYKTAKTILKQLQDAGFEAYLAGGCVRDMLLGLEPKDYDIVTSATPEEVEGLLSKTIPVGKQFGVILAIENGHQFEIATFRSDSGYSDGRRPDYVTFTNPREDAQRRDFTINGMFMNPLKDNEVLDFVDGQRYLRSKIIHFIGDPDERIKEDHLRLIRAVRFAHQIGGQYHPDTYAAIKRHAHLIQDVSKERICLELNKILLSPTRAHALEDLQDLGLLTYILPEIELMKGIAQPLMYHKEGSVWAHVMRSIHSLGKRPKLELVWATLLHDVGKPHTFSVEERIRFDGHAEKSAEIAEDILRRLRFPGKDIKKIVWAVEHHMMCLNVLDDNMKDATRKKWLLHPDFPLLMELHKADASGAVPKDLTGYKAMKELYKTVKASLPKQLPVYVTGHDLLKTYSVQPGPLVGKILDEIHEAQLEHRVSSKEEAMKLAEEIIEKQRRP